MPRCRVRPLPEVPLGREPWGPVMLTLDWQQGRSEEEQCELVGDARLSDSFRNVLQPFTPLAKQCHKHGVTNHPSTTGCRGWPKRGLHIIRSERVVELPRGGFVRLRDYRLRISNRT